MMASKLLHGLFYIFFVEQISTDKVNIVGPDFVKIGEPIYIRCMSDVPSFAETAEFKVNNIRYTIIRKQSNGCFSSREGSRCSSTLCQCSSEGKAFSLKIIAPIDKYALRISCMMRFIKDGKQFSSEAVLAVSVLDIRGPFVSFKPELPLNQGILAEVSCEVHTRLQIANLLLECFSSKFSKVKREQDKLVVTSRKVLVSIDHNAKPCTCTLTKETFNVSTTITLDVRSTPILEIDEHNNCNTSASINLTCNLSGGPKALGFGYWTHSFEGKFIRNLNGSIRNKTSILEIETCKDQDLGEYTCNVWSSQNRQMAWTHKTTMINVNAAVFVTTVAFATSLTSIKACHAGTLDPRKDKRIYYAAPPIQESSHPYDETNPNYPDQSDSSTDLEYDDEFSDIPDIEDENHYMEITDL